MIANGVDYPNQLVDSIIEGNLVVFAGAGVSMDLPTNLPNFNNMANEIAEETEYDLKTTDSCEVFLGMLKAKGIPVNNLAAEILSAACLKHNRQHEAIIELFPDSKNIRLVTTNYDQMFEQVLSIKKIEVPVYNVPALPLGSDVTGIVHIHGNVDNPKYMVLTDEDFGRAYLTEGYASRFLVDLFETYTVLFIGYSYSDTILRYLTRAMSRQNQGKKYILTDNANADWLALGITPIWFPEGKFTMLRDSLIKLGRNVRRGLLDWKTQFSGISDAPPKDLTIDTEIDYCLESVERTRVLAGNIHGKDWIHYIDKKHVFDSIFSDKNELSEKDRIWANWLCDNFIGTEDDAVIKLVLRYHNKISKEFADKIAYKLFGNKTLSNESFSEYLMLIEDTLLDPWDLSRLIEESLHRGLNVLGYRLYQKLFVCRMILRNVRYFENNVEYKHSFVGTLEETGRLWNELKDRILYEDGYSVMLFVGSKIEEVHDRYSIVNHTEADEETRELARYEIEDKERQYNENSLSVLLQMYLDAALYLQDVDESWLKITYINNLHSKSILLRRIVLKAIRETHVFSYIEKLNMLFDFEMLYDSELKEQVFLLVADIFNELEENEKNRLIDEIEVEDKDDELKQIYEKYKWGVWLKRIDTNNVRVNAIVNKLKEKYAFTDLDHPERYDVGIKGIQLYEDSPLSAEELFDFPCDEAVVFLREYKEPVFGGPYRYALLRVFSSCVSKDYNWTRTIALELISQKISDEEVWQNFFNGLFDADFSFKEDVDLLEILVPHISVFGFDKELAYYLFNIVRREEAKNFMPEFEDRLFVASKTIWNRRRHKKSHFERKIDATLNTTAGTILLSWVYMVSFYDETVIHKQYKDCFEQALSLRNWEKYVVVCVLAGHFNLLFYKDNKWSKKNLLPLLDADDKRTFANAWEGLMHFSHRIDQNTAEVIRPVYFHALEHLSWLSDDVKNTFFNLLIILLVYVVDNPTYKFIPRIYKYATEKDIATFLREIKHRLGKMENEEKKEWWDNWLKRFLDNRKKNKPVLLSDEENILLFDLLVELEIVFDDAVETMCRGALPSNLSSWFWISFDKKHIAIRKPHETYTMLIKVLNVASVNGFDAQNVYRIAKDIVGLDENEQRQLQEIMLRRNLIC